MLCDGNLLAVGQDLTGAVQPGHTAAHHTRLLVCLGASQDQSTGCPVKLSGLLNFNVLPERCAARGDACKLA